MSLVFLRNDSKTQTESESIATVNNPPSALVELAKIVNDDLCHRCGSCVGICPTDVLSNDHQEFPVIKNLSSCINCNLCVKVCPGVDFDVPKYTERVFQREPNLLDMHGYFKKAFLGYASDPKVRLNATSGGVGTAVLGNLLETGQIDGAIVCKAKDDELWRGEPVIVRSKDELLANAKPKYMVSSTNSILSVIAKTPGRYAIVGIPCQIHGIRKATRYLKKLNDRIALTIGVFCHATVAHPSMRLLWQILGADDPEVVNYIPRYGKHPGTPHLVYKDGSIRPLFFPNTKGYRPTSTEILNILYRLDTQPRCFSCFDHTSEFADISIGDPWMPPPNANINFKKGYSFVLARTDRGLEALQSSHDLNKVSLQELDVKTAKTCNSRIGNSKRWRAFYYINKNQHHKKPAPNYHFDIPKLSLKWHIKSKLDILTHSMSFKNFNKKPILLFVFSPVGYILLWLNYQRRALRDAIIIAKKRKENKIK